MERAERKGPRRGAGFHAAEVMRRIARSGGDHSVEVFRHGTLLVKLYAPRGVDPQTPHHRDEAYVVVTGRGLFFDGEARRPFEPGDFLFAPAGCIHRFEDFTDDLAVWVVFYGPEGGEGEDTGGR